MANVVLSYEKNMFFTKVRSWVSLEKYGILVAFIVMMLTFSVLQVLGYVNNFIEIHNLTNQMRNASLLFFIVAGQSMVLLVSGIDLSQGSLLSLSCVVMAQGILDFGLVFRQVFALRYLGRIPGADCPCSVHV